jgi:hypothetical protein
MSFDYKNFEDLFYENFVIPTYKQWRDGKGSGKDIVGKNFEEFNKLLYRSFGLSVLKKSRKILNTEFNPDVVIVENTDDIIIVEEDKGHYLDSTFFKRAMVNAGEIIFECIENNVTVPYIIISCPTTYKKYDIIFNKQIRIFNNNIGEIMRERLIYHPLCLHDRVKANKYFKEEGVSPFKLDKELVEKRINFIYKIKNGIK